MLKAKAQLLSMFMAKNMMAM
jgi:hypothetical protein